MIPTSTGSAGRRAARAGRTRRAACRPRSGATGAAAGPAASGRRATGAGDLRGAGGSAAARALCPPASGAVSLAAADPAGPPGRRAIRAGSVSRRDGALAGPPPLLDPVPEAGSGGCAPERARDADDAGDAAAREAGPKSGAGRKMPGAGGAVRRTGRKPWPAEKSSASLSVLRATAAMAMTAPSPGVQS